MTDSPRFGLVRIGSIVTLLLKRHGIDPSALGPESLASTLRKRLFLPNSPVPNILNEVFDLYGKPSGMTHEDLVEFCDLVFQPDETVEPEGRAAVHRAIRHWIQNPGARDGGLSSLRRNRDKHHEPLFALLEKKLRGDSGSSQATLFN